MKYYASLMILWNLVVINLYRIDKKRSLQKRHRIKESTLLISAFIFGGIGAGLGMIMYNHKIKKTKFRILVLLAIFLNILAIMYIENCMTF